MLPQFKHSCDRDAFSKPISRIVNPSELESGMKGRENQLATLLKSLGKVVEGQDFEVVSVEGVGRTTFVKSLQDVQSLFVYGKCDQFKKEQPYRALAAALNEMCGKFASRYSITQEEMTQVSERDFVLLSRWLPNLSKLIQRKSRNLGSSSIPSRRWRQEDIYQFPMAVCNLLQALSSHPKILVMDDIQWCDQDSMLALRVIADNEDISNLLFIVSSSVPVEIYSNVDINLLPLTQDQVQQYLSERLSENDNTGGTIPPKLAKTLFEQTNGDPFYTNEMIEYLQRNEILTTNSDGVYECREVPPASLSLIMNDKISRYQEMQPTLTLAAHAGFFFQKNQLILEETVDDGTSSKDVEISSILSQACHAGFIAEAGNTGWYRFSHDKYQVLFHALLKQPEALHLSLGRSKALDKFQHVQHLYLARDLVSDSADIVHQLREASSQAMDRGAYFAATFFLLQACTFLTPCFWTNQYLLTLDTMNKAAQMAYLVNDIQMCRLIIERVLQHAENKSDKLQVTALSLELLSVGIIDANTVVKFGTSALAEFNIFFPPVTKPGYLKLQLYKIKRALKAMSDSNVLSLPALQRNTEMARVVEILGMTSHYAYIADDERFSVFGFNRLLQISFSHGITSFSSYALVMFALVLQSAGKLKEAQRYAQLAVDLSKRSDQQEYACHTLRIACQYILHTKLNLNECISPCYRAYESAVAVGNIGESYAAAALLGQTLFHAGVSLQTVASYMKKIHRNLEKYKQVHRTAMPVWQAALNLMGDSIDPVKLTGKIMIEEDVIREALEANDTNLIQQIRCFKLQIAVIFRAWEIARIQIREYEKGVTKYMLLTHDYMMFEFYCAIVNFEIARHTNNRKYLVRARKITKGFQKYEKTSGYCKQLHLFLRAEGQSRKDPIIVASTFGKALEEMNNEEKGMTQIEAFCNERAARYTCASTSFNAKKAYLHRAADLYKQWGARSKSEDLRTRFSNCFLESWSTEKSAISENTFITSNKSRDMMYSVNSQGD